MHLPYRNIDIIKLPLILFYTLAIDFILVLPKSRSSNNYVILYIYKFSKIVTAIARKII